MSANRLIKSVQIPSLEEIEREKKRLNYKNNYKASFKSTIGILVVVSAISVLISMLFCPVLQVFGNSMQPTFEDGDIVVLVKHQAYKQGDICAFYYQNKVLIKRIIALPGSYIDIKDDGTVYVDGKELEEPYLESKAYGNCDIEFPYQVPENSYFIMGDLRDESIDSRNSIVGCIPKSQLGGKYLFRVWPLKKNKK